MTPDDYKNMKQTSLDFTPDVVLQFYYQAVHGLQQSPYIEFIDKRTDKPFTSEYLAKKYFPTIKKEDAIYVSLLMDMTGYIYVRYDLNNQSTFLDNDDVYNLYIRINIDDKRDTDVILKNNV